MSDELKPCPCCGNMHLETTANVNESNNLGRCGAVWCECGLHMSARSLEEAMARWNARAERTCRNTDTVPDDGSVFYPSPHFRCSECGASYALTGYAYYCPNCGAKVAG